MLRKFAAALLATTLVAGTAFAAESGSAGSTPANPATQAAPAMTNAKAGAQVKAQVKPASVTKTVKHAHKNTRKHLARAKTGKGSNKMHQARHVKGTKTHQASGTKSGAGSANRS
jgi:hypothetical protein